MKPSLPIARFHLRRAFRHLGQALLLALHQLIAQRTDAAASIEDHARPSTRDLDARGVAAHHRGVITRARKAAPHTPKPNLERVVVGRQRR